jgi:hypothetical protein
MPVTYPFGEECFTYGERERQEDFRATSGNLQDTSNFLLSILLSQFDPLTIFSSGNIPCKWQLFWHFE